MSGDFLVSELNKQVMFIMSNLLFLYILFSFYYGVFLKVFLTIIPTHYTFYLCMVQERFLIPPGCYLW